MESLPTAKIPTASPLESTQAPPPGKPDTKSQDGLADAQPPKIDLDERSSEELEKRMKWVPVKAQGLLRRAVTTKSRSASIKAMCQHCFGYEDFVSGIRDCKSRLCPLWTVRPYQTRKVAVG